MQIVEKKLTEIHPYERNPRKNDSAVDAVAASIREFGFRVPLVIDREGTIVCGHTRYKAAKKMKMQSIPCVVADDLSNEQVNAFRLADNKVGEIAEWDLDALMMELDGLDVDMEQFGFDAVSELEQHEVKEDDYDEPVPDEPKSKRGQIYALGNHRLMCGDSTNENDVIRLMGGENADVLFSSPPYGAGDSAKIRNHYVKGESKIKSFYNTHEDKPNEWGQLIRDAFINGEKYSIVQIWNIQMLADNKQQLIELLYEHRNSLCDIVVWDKGKCAPQMHENVLNNVFEFIFILGNNTRAIPLSDFHGNKQNMWRISTGQNQYADIHKAVFPVQLAAEALNLCGKGENCIRPIWRNRYNTHSSRTAWKKMFYDGN